MNRATRAEERTCPACPAILDRVTVHGIDLDVCVEHGTWFDAFELATLVRILRGEAAPAEPGRTVQCARCHCAITADRANVTDVGLQCDGCWRSQQAAEIAAFDQRIEAQGAAGIGAVTVGGVLLGIAAAMLGSSNSS